MCIHPSLCIHQTGELGTTLTSLDFVGIDDGFLDFIQHGDSLLHLSGVAHSCSHRVMNHEHGYRRYQHLCTCHSDDRCSRGCDAINLYGDIAGILHHHVVNLGCGHTVASRRVNPNGDVSLFGKQFISKELRCDIIVKPAFLCDGAV